MDQYDDVLQQARERHAAKQTRAKELLGQYQLEDEVAQAPKTRGWLMDQHASAYRGVIKAAKSMMSGAESLGNWLTSYTGDFRVNVGNGRPTFEHIPAGAEQPQGAFGQAAEGYGLIADAIGAPETKTGAFVESGSQFVAGMIPVSRSMKAVGLLQKATSGGRALNGVVSSAVTAGLAFEGHEGNLANFIQEYPSLQNPITEFLAVDGDDSEGAARLKNAAADAALGLPIEGLLGSLRALRASRAAKKALDAEEVVAEVDAPDLGSMKSTPAPKVEPEVPAPKTAEPIEAPKVAAKDADVPPEDAVVGQLSEDVKATKEEIAVLDEATKKTGEPDSPYAAQGESATLDELSQKLGVDGAKLDELRAKIESGEAKPEDVSKLLGFNHEHVDWKKIGGKDAAEDVAGLMNTVTQVFEEALGKAGGARVSTKAINEMAGKLGMTMDGVAGLWQRTRGRSGKGIAAEFFAARTVLWSSAKHLKGLADAVRKGTAHPEQMLEFVTHLRRHATLQAVMKGTQSEIARALYFMRAQAGANEMAFKLANGKAIKRQKALTEKLVKLEKTEKKARAAADKKRAERAKAEGKEPPKPREQKPEEPKAPPVVENHPTLTGQDVQEALKEAGVTWDDILRMAGEVADLTDEEAINRAARTGYERIRDGVVSLYVNNLLSGVRTLTMNVVPAVWRAFVGAPLERYGAAAIATMRRGSVDKYEWVLANKAMVATYTNSWNALKLAKQTFLEGVPQTDAAARHEVAAHNEAIPGVVGKVLQLPSRLILTIDEVFKQLSYQQELTSRAVEVAAEMARTTPGKVNQEVIFKNVFDSVMKNPTDDLVADAIQRSRYDTYQAALESRFNNTLLNLTSHYPLLKLVMPFIKTPANIMKQAVLERTPIALLRKKIQAQIKAGGREGNEALWRVAVGSSAIGVTLMMAINGRITGSRVGKGQNRNGKDMSGAPPYAVQFGDTWYQFNRMDPLGTVLGLVGEAVDLARDATMESSLKEKTVWNLLADAGHIVSENITDKVYFKGISDLLEAAHGDNATLLERYVDEKLAALVPFSSLSRSLAQQHAEYARSTFGLIDKLKADSPWFIDSLPLQRDYLGRPIPFAERLGPDWASPFIIGEKDQDPAAQAFARLGKSYQMPAKSIDGVVKMSNEQYSRYVEVRGQRIHSALTEAISNGRWEQMNRGQKLDFISDAEKAGTKRAKKTLKREFPDIKQKLSKYETELKFLEDLPE